MVYMAYRCQVQGTCVHHKKTRPLLQNLCTCKDAALQSRTVSYATSSCITASYITAQFIVTSYTTDSYKTASTYPTHRPRTLLRIFPALPSAASQPTSSVPHFLQCCQLPFNINLPFIALPLTLLTQLRYTFHLLLALLGFGFLAFGFNLLLEFA